MKKIVRGNDFRLRVPVMKIVDGEKVAFPLPGCTDIRVNIVNQYRRIALSYTIDVSEDNVLLARVEGDKVAVGTYALEVKGKLFGNDWRSNEYEQFQIVDNNASGDTVFEAQEGEDSVEMDTALVVLAPAVELGNLIKDAEETIADTKEALKGVETKMGDIEQRTDTAIGAATTAAERANTAAERAEQTNSAVKNAEQERVVAEQERKAAEEQRKSQMQSNAQAEQARADAEQHRVEAEKRRASAETMRAAAEETRKKDEADRRAGETSREKQEVSRVIAEQTRDEQETRRKANEAQRADAENTRKRMEADRANAETERVAAEKARAAAETARADAETKRAAAETKRETDFSVKVAEVDTAVKNAKTATSEAEKVDATITAANVLEVTGRDGVKKSLELVEQAEASEMKADVARIKESIGAYSDRPNITLTAKENNVAISADGVKVRKQGWSIAEFTAELGNIYLFNPGETSSDVCVFAEYIDKVETRAIDYAYTYDESGRVLTAKATYNGKTYTYTYDYSSSITSITDQDGNNVSSLPSVYTTTVGTYQPMTILNANAELPVDGYCRFVSNFTTASAIKIMVSYKVSSADLTMKVVRDGSTANMCSQLAKINKKVDEVSAKIPDMWMDICSIQPMGVNVNGKTYILEAGKNYRFEDVFSLDFQVNGYYHLRNIKRLNFHFNKMNCPLNVLKLFTNKKIVEYGMNYLQHGCESLTELDVSGFDTSRSRSLEFTFALCWNLEKVDVASWNTSNVISMRNTFSHTALKVINVECWDTSKVMNMNAMFMNSRVETLDLSRWNTENVKDMMNIFNTCNYLKKLDVSNFNTAKITNMSGIFYNCALLEALDLSKWDTSAVTSLQNMFLYDRKITTLTFGENFGKMKDECGTLDLSSLGSWKNDSVKSLLTLYDRKANGMGVITIKLHANTKAVLGEDGIAQLTAKGYIIA